MDELAELLTPSALLCSKALLMIIHDMPIWATSKDCPFGTFRRVALSRSLSFRVTVALLWSSPSHLSPCQDSSLIYHKAFIQINTATQQLPRTHKLAHTHTQVGTRKCILCNSTLPDSGLWSEQNQTRLFWARLSVWFTSFFFVDCSRSTRFPHFSSTWFSTVLLPSSASSYCTCEKAVPWDGGGGGQKRM